MKSPNGKLNTNFHNNKITKGGSQCICLSVILIDSVMRTSSNYYPQMNVNIMLKEKRCLSILLMV